MWEPSLQDGHFRLPIDNPIVQLAIGTIILLAVINLVKREGPDRQSGARFHRG